MADHVCPVWVGHLLASPLRKIFQNPRLILGPYVTTGMQVLDTGCAMGFFSLPLAQMVGANGKVVCVDVQAKMLRALEERALKAGLAKRIETRLCRSDTLDLNDLAGTFDFVLAFAVVHEVPRADVFYAEVSAALKPNGRILLAEPKGHVSEEAFAGTVDLALSCDLVFENLVKIRRSHGAVMRKAANS